MILRYLIISLLFVCSLYGQTASEVLKMANDKFNASKTLQFNTRYNLYKKHSDVKVHQTYDGLFMKNALNEVYMRIDKTEFLNTNRFNVKISHYEKAILVSDKQPLSMGDFDIKKIQKLCTISSFKTHKTHWEIVLIPKEFSGLNFSKIVIFMNKNHTISKQVFYYNTGHNFSKDYTKSELSNPKLEIVFTNYTSKLSDLLKLNANYVLSTGKNNKIIPASTFKKYEVTDIRTRTLKNK